MGYTVQASLPSTYHEPHCARRDYPVLYVLSSGFFTLVAEQCRGQHAATSSQEGRQWFPDAIVIGLSAPDGVGVSDLLCFMGSTLLGFVDGRYRTKPYAVGRGLCGFALHGSHVSHALFNQECVSKFGYYMVGCPATEHCVEASESLLKEGGVFLFASEGDSHAYMSGLKQSLDGAGASASADQQVVDIDPSTGEQRLKTVAKESSAMEMITLDVLPAGTDEETLSSLFAERGVTWVGERLEKRKLDSLARQFAWGEFI